MNHIYRLIWNTTLACWVVASEHTRSRGKRTRTVRAAAAAFALALPLAALAADEDRTTEEDTVSASDFTTALLRHNNDALLRTAGADIAPLALNRALQATVNDTYFANATLSGENSLVLGSRASVTGNRSTGIGNEVVISGGGHTVLGSKASAIGGRDAVAIGINATAAGTGNVAIGEAARADTVEGGSAGIHAVAIGALARAGSPGWTGAVAMGGSADATHDGVALGYSANALNVGAMALGRNASGTAAGAIAVGRYTQAKGDGAIAIGEGALASYANGIAFGRQADANNSWANAFGFQAKARGAGATAIGYQAESNSAATVAIGWQTKANGSHSVAIGAFSDVDTNATDSVALGRQAKVGATAASSVALGSNSVATAVNTVSVGSASLKRRIVNVADGDVTATSTDAVNGRQLHAVGARLTGQELSLGQSSSINGPGGIAIGNAAAVVTAGGVGGTAIGSNARAGTSGWSGGTAVGSYSTADYDGLALGHDAHARASQSVALGRGSVATEGRTVSVGSDTIKRRIVNVADGTLGATSTDAVTGKQLFATNQNVTTATNTANTAKTTADAALDKATVVSGLIGQVSPTGSVRVGGENTGAVLDVRSKSNANRAITGVADGALSAASTEAVTGKQLFATDQKVTAVTTTANTAKATADAAQLNAVDALGKANHLNGLVSQANPNGVMRLGGENAGFVMDVRNSNGGSRTLSGVAAGALHASSSEAVNGAQLGAVNDRVELHSVAIAVNRLEIGVNRDGLDELREAFDNFEPDLSGVVRYNADRSLVDLDGAGLSGLTAGEISASSREAINGSQLFGTNERVGSLEAKQRYVMVGADELSGPARAGDLGVAVGSDAVALAEGATALGSFSNAGAVNSVAIGRGSYVAETGVEGFALGSRTQVLAAAGLAVGASSVVMADARNSVALGNASVATEADSVSVGNDNLKRRIVNVGRGTAGADATTVSQLTETLSALGGGAGLDATGHLIAPNYVLSGDGYTNVGDALTFLDTKLLSHQDELDALDTQYKAFAQNDRSIRYNDDRSVVDFGGARLTGLAAGSIKADSSDAVNGAQLFATNERVGYVEQQQRYVMVGTDELSGAAQAGIFGVAVGGDATAREEGATAVGSFASALGRNSVALGRGSYVALGATNGFALGTRSNVESAGGMAIGSDSYVMTGAEKSIALGNASVATEANTVSLGNDGLKRRIVNVAQGIKSDDATTVSQLRGALSALGGGADLDANGNVIGPRYAVQGSEYGSFGDAITALDGSVGDNKRNLDTLDSRFQRLFQESPSANADGAGRLNFGGAQGMVLGNVANGLIGQGSRDAVNGGQLWAVKEDLQGQIDALDPAKGEVSGSPLAMNARSGSITPSADGGSQLAPPEATPPAADPGTVAAQDQLVKAEGDNAVAVGSEGKERQVKHVAEGRADTDAANVRQVNDALDRANAYTDSAVASVNQRLDQVDKRINRMAAISSAQSAMAMNTAGLATANRLGAGVGYSEGESAMAVGYQRVLTERGSATFSLNGAFTNSGEKSVGVGVGIGW